MSLAFFRSASSSDSIASETGLPSGSAPPFFSPSPSIFDLSAARSSSTPPPSKALNLSSRSLDAVSIPTASASASIPITFSSIFSNALSAEDVLTPETRSCTALFVFALAARALSVSFLLLASAILLSKNRVFEMSFSTAFSCSARFAFIESAFSWYDFFLDSASRASSSSPLLIASSARRYQSSAVACACLYLFSSCFCDAITCADAWRIFTRSSCISMTV
mmetsp:Transcript_11633/g.41874  ORF Transcript_11633/g.41874 Transcript_11633/m.41874 type:complete len:222 (+) Transcript_11633:1706-2371(+)